MNTLVSSKLEANKCRGGRLRQDSKRDITEKRNKFKFSYSRRAREISAFVARIVVLYKLKMQYHAHPSAITLVQRARGRVHEEL
jgi:hypothetical protein